MFDFSLLGEWSAHICMYNLNNFLGTTTEDSLLEQFIKYLKTHCSVLLRINCYEHILLLLLVFRFRAQTCDDIHSCLYTYNKLAKPTAAILAQSTHYIHFGKPLLTCASFSSHKSVLRLTSYGLANANIRSVRAQFNHNKT